MIRTLTEGTKTPRATITPQVNSYFASLDLDRIYPNIPHTIKTDITTTISSICQI